MTPLWLPSTDKKDRLVVVRHVQILGRVPDDVLLLCTWPRPALPFTVATAAALQFRKVPYPREVCQGILLSWETLQEQLSEEVQDLFPSARLQPVRFPCASTRLARANVAAKLA